MPKAVVRDNSQSGGPETFCVREVPAINPYFCSCQSVRKAPRSLGSYDVAVRVAYTSVDPAELKIGADKYSSTSCVPGTDFSGLVIAIGDKVTKYAVGDEVFGEIAQSSASYGNGTWSEETITQEDCCVLKPPTMPFTIAGSLGSIALTSMTAIKYYSGDIMGGQKILVIGGCTGTGMMLIQLAKAYGSAFIAATCSSGNEARMHSLGLDLVLDESSKDWTADLPILVQNNLDVIYDCVGGTAHWDYSLKVLKPSWGKYITVPGTEGESLPGLAGTFNRKFWSFFGYPAYYEVKTCPNAEYLAEVVRLIEAGKVKVFIDSEHPFTTEGVRAALERASGRDASGRVLIKIESVAESIDRIDTEIEEAQRALAAKLAKAEELRVLTVKAAERKRDGLTPRKERE